MATDFSKPLVTDSYAALIPGVKQAFQDLAKSLDPATTGSNSNIPTNAIRWTSAAKKWQLYNGTAWADLTDKYAISISGNADTATSATTAGSATTATTATHVAGGGAGTLLYQSAANTTAKLAAGTNGYILTMASGVPAWVAQSSLAVGSATTAGSATNAGDSANLGGFAAATYGRMSVVNTWDAKQIFTGYQKLQAALEKVTPVDAAATGTIQYDVSTQGVLFYTFPAAANFTLNFRANSGATLDSVMAINECITVVFMTNNGTTPYYPTAITIDSVSFTPSWQGGTAPTSGFASSIDVYTYTIIKRSAATFLVLASQSQFK